MKKHYEKAKLLIGAVSVLCILSLAGCNTDVNNNTHNTNNITNTNGEKPTVTDGTNNSSTNNSSTNNSSTNNSTGNNDANSLFELSTIQGSVINFSDDGCMITPTKTANTADGGMVAEGAAPGHENPDENITIHYQSGCVFQIAKINISSGISTISEANISDIKKQTSLAIYGDWIDEYNLNATKVIITRFE